MNVADDDRNTADVLRKCVVALLSAGPNGGASAASNGEASATTSNTAASPAGGGSPVPPTEPLGHAGHGAPTTSLQEWPEVTFSCFFTQDLPDVARLKLPAGVAACGDVGAGSEMDSSFLEAEELFSKLFPDVVFLTKAPAVGVETNKEAEEQGDDLDQALKALGLV